MTSVNLCKPIYDIKSYSTLICPFESGKCEKERTKIQNFQYLKNKNRFLDEKRAFLYRVTSLGGKAGKMSFFILGLKR